MLPYYSDDLVTLYHGDALELGLRVIGIEAEEQWCEIAAERLAQPTLDIVAEAPVSIYAEEGFDLEGIA